ncbi:hypothetical protein H8E88_00685, partial [candidate division KSB1 bacterium]|nr:hypothetical protein [candidate division KSB1 bacterium]
MKRKQIYLICIFLILFFNIEFVTAQEGWHSIRQDYWPCSFYSVFFLPDGQTGWAVGSNGVIVHTSDGGSSWSSQTSGTSNYLLSVHFSDSRTGWAVGGYGTIVHTSDGGSSWSSQTSGTSNWLWSVHFSDSQTGWAVGSNGTIVHTSDGGSSWSSQT